jgi:hypothetical protein
MMNNNQQTENLRKYISEIFEEDDIIERALIREKDKLIEQLKKYAPYFHEKEPVFSSYLYTYPYYFKNEVPETKGDPSLLNLEYDVVYECEYITIKENNNYIQFELFYHGYGIERELIEEIYIYKK